MAIFIAQFTIPTLAALALAKLFQAASIEKLDKKLYYAAGIAGGLCLIFWMVPSIAGEFTTPNDSQITGAGYPADVTQRIMSALYEDRENMVSSDALRSLFFILLAAAAVFSIAKGWIKPLYATAAVAFLALLDLWSVDKRYLNKDNFQKSYFADQFQPTAADQAILQDKGLNNRVLNLNSPFTESKTSYYHKSIGGYSPVKIRRYQDLIENDLTNEIQDVGLQLRQMQTAEHVFTLDFLKNERILNMLNTKYLKANEEANGVITNPFALGNAWFVQQVQTVKSPDEEMAATRTFDPATTALVDGNKFKVSKTSFSAGGQAKLLEARGNYLKYNAENAADGLLVFSEIYYAEGWKATIDGKEAPILRANYVLRALEVPAGKHEIVFKFEPASFVVGNKISLFSSIGILLLMGFVAFKSLTGKREEASSLEN